MLDAIAYFHFLRPYCLLLLLPFAGLIYLNWRRSKQQQAWQKSMPEHLVKALRVGEQGWTKQLPLKLLTLICIIAIIILAGPSYYKEPSPFGEDATPLVIVLDASDSMLERDVLPNRLQFAKQKIQDLLELRQQGKNALIVYSGSAHLAMPLTQDKDVFKPLLEAISPKVMPRAGKNAEYSIALIDKTLQQSEVPGSVLLITDTVTSKAARALGHYFSQKPHQLQVLAMGNPKVDSQMPVAIDKLKQLTDETDGEFILTEVNNDDLTEVEHNIQQYMRMNAETAMPWADVGYVLVFIMAGLYLLWFRKGWLVKWGFVLVMMSSTTVSFDVSAAEQNSQQWRFVDLWLTGDQQGRYYFDKGDYQTAASRFEDPYWKGIAYYYSDQYEAALQHFMLSESLDSKFAAGATLAQLTDFKGARDMFQEVVDFKPDYVGAQRNLNLMLMLIYQLEGDGAHQMSGMVSDSGERANGLIKLKDSSKKTTKRQKLKKDITAEQLLQDKQLSDKWMNRVDSKMENFLMVKFHLQLKQGIATQEYQADE